MTKKVKIASRKKSVKKMVVVKPRKARAKTKRASHSMAGWGELAGGYLGGPTGAMVGRAAGGLISKITGFGDYKVNSNTVLKGNSVPTFRNDSDGMAVCHREYLVDVTGSVGFSLFDFAINPGLASSFPLLSRIASVFEEYEMRGLVYEYRPSSGSAVSSASSALGVVIIATDYDSTNPDFVNKQQMESYEYSTSTVPFTGCLHPVECARGKNVLDNLYLRTQSPAAGTDIRVYDLGKVQIATQGMQSSYVVGELWVSYDVRLRKPRLPSGFGSQLLSYARVITSPSGTATDQNLFGTNTTVLTSDSDLTNYAISTTNTAFTMTFRRPGYYCIMHRVQGSFSTGGPPAFAGVSGSNISGSPPNIFNGNSVGGFSQSTISNIPTGIRVSYQIIQVLAFGNSVANQITLTSTSFGWSAGNSDYHVWCMGDIVPPMTVTQDLAVVLKKFDTDFEISPSHLIAGDLSDSESKTERDEWS